ncbi:lamin tail domain-containing protein [Verrucomicrobia bacterium]|nr:lamin tail domain-containing protein [Verrucomicrobiota bacterium]
MKNQILIGAFFGLIAAFSFRGHAGTLIAKESQWHAWPGNQAPSAETLKWVEFDFNDSEWSKGRAPFRYGDGAGGTEIKGMRNTYSTYFLRRHFAVDSVSLVEGLELNVDYDDGFVVWLNGNEVLRVNAPDALALNGFASQGHESGSFEVFSLNRGIAHLRDGDNVIAVQGFNVNLSSSDFVLHPELNFIGLDTQAPSVIAVEPAPGLVGVFRQVRVTFSEPVVGVEASDLTLNGKAASSLTGSGDAYLFTFTNTEPGELTLRWEQDAGIVDLAATPNEFDWQNPSEIRSYQLMDQDAPFVSRILPLPGQQLSGFTEVEILFSETVKGLDASDLLADGEPALSLSGAGAGPYIFSFPRVSEGSPQLEWRLDHGIEDFASEPNPLQTNAWEYTIDPQTNYGGVIISEILAANQSGIMDDDRARVDWIELHNTNDFDVDLSGWALSDDIDDPGKWMFGEFILAPNEYKLVYASAKGRSNHRPGRSPHTNFKLSSAGEFIGLYSPELPRRLVSDLGNRFPEQRNDHSYGRRSDGQFGYFSSPSPGSANSNETLSEILPPASFSARRGFYDKPFNLVISPSIEGTSVRYTLDKSEPTLINGFKYDQPISLSRSTIVRAAVFKEGYLPSETFTHSYLFRLSAARRSLPVLSLVTDNDHLWGAQGIMETSPRNTSKRGRSWERPVSVEYFLPDGSTGFQIDCGLRIQGGDYVRGRYNPNGGLPFSKYSYRLYFRGDYGESALRYPFIPRSPEDEYKQIVLRAGMNDHSDPFIVDELVRRLSADMGQVSSQGTLVNLYVNGVYKGYYNPTERIDEDFLDTWQGGNGDYDIIAQFGEVRAGDLVKWNQLKQTLRRDLSVAANYEQARQLLNIDSFIDYLILNIYAGTRDWPHNNWRAARERVDGAKWRFYAWDAEWSFFNQGGSVRHNTLTSELAVNQDIARFYQSLSNNTEFRTRFADRVYQHFFNNGALTDANILSRFQELRGDMSGMRNINNSIARSWIPQRRQNVLSHLAAEGLFLESNVPRFSEPAGSMRANALSLDSEQGDIYYTLDGTDPLLPSITSSTRTELISNRTIKFAHVPTDGILGTKWRAEDPDIDTADWVRGRGGVGYDENQTYETHIGIDVNASMNDKNTTAYIVIPFNVRSNDLDGRNLMDLRVKYDDGFAAYLNGKPIAAANAPSRLQWNTSANGDHPDASAVIFQSFNVSDHMQLLKEGGNTLAIHGLNAQLSSSDFLFDVLLEVGVEQPGRVADSAVLYKGPIPIKSVTQIKARALINGRWSAMSSGDFYPGGLTPELKLTEIMYHPPGGDAFEFVELTNFSPVSVNLSRYSFRGISFLFAPESYLESGGIILLASDKNPAAFQSRYPSVSVWGYFAGSLSNGGESLILEDEQGKYVTGVRYGDEGAWPISADGGGNSLEFRIAAGSNSNPADWCRSLSAGGSPGRFVENESQGDLVISEIVAANRTIKQPSGLLPDWIELENRSDRRLNLGGYRLRDESGRSGFVFPKGSFIEPAERLVLWQTVSGSDPEGFPFGLDREGDSVFLLDPQGNQVDAVTFGHQLFDYSLNRDDHGEWFLGEPSPAQKNRPTATASLVDSLRINEFMANPLAGEEDWLEVVNLNDALPVDLSGLHFALDGYAVGLSSQSFLEAGGHRAFYSVNIPRRGSLRFKIPSAGAELGLLDSQGNLLDKLSFGLQIEGTSSGRLPDGVGEFQQFSEQATPGQKNVIQESSSIVINEIMARNQTVIYPGMAGTPDWIELFNKTDGLIDLSGMSLRLDGTDEWVLPDGIYLEGHDHFVVWFDGDDLIRRGEFSGIVVDRSLPPSGASIELLTAEGRQLDQLRFGIQLMDHSIGRKGDQWQLLAQGTPGAANASAVDLGLVNDLRINEWSGGGDGDDWLELYHAGTQALDLSGIYLTDDPSLIGKTKHPIANLSFIGPKSWIVFNADGEPQRGSNHLNFRLSARGETLRIYSESLNVIDEILVAGSPLNGGSSGRLPDGENLISSFSVLESSSGRPNHRHIEGLQMNELLFTPQAPSGRAIELFNSGADALDISDWAIGSERTSLDAFRLPTGTIVQPGEFTVLHESMWVPSEVGHSSDWIVSESERIYLSEVNTPGNATGRRLSIPVLPTYWNESFGNVELSYGEGLARLDAPTFGVSISEPLEAFQGGTGEQNAMPWLGPLIVSELLIDSHASGIELPMVLDGVEFIEIFNRSSERVTLSSSENTLVGWRIAGGVSYHFESDVILEPMQVLLLVNYDPNTEPMKNQALQQNWGLPLDVSVLGPFDGRLDNEGDRVRLQQLAKLPKSLTGQHEAESLGWIDEDRIDYQSNIFWAIPPQNENTSLMRLGQDSFGNDPANWHYATPTPGRFGKGGSPNPTSGLIQSLSFSKGQVILLIATQPGINHTVQLSNSLNPAEWKTLETLMGTGNSEPVIDSSPVNETRFYRVLLD